MTGEELRAARLKLGLTAQTFSHLVGASGRVHIHKWEAGDAPVSVSASIIVRALLASPAVRDYFGVPPGGDEPSAG